MSTTSVTERLSMEIESSALTFLTRPQLLRLSTVSYRMRCILLEDFTSKPYLLLDDLQTDPYWGINFHYLKIERFIELLAESKFVRFKSVDLSWASLKNDNEKNLLKEISHVCQDAELRIESFGGMMTQQAFMPLIANCSSLYLSGYETIEWLPHILPSYNLQTIYVSEKYVRGGPLDIPEACLEAIVEFLFKPMNNHKSRELRIRVTISNQSTQAMSDAIKKDLDHRKQQRCLTWSSKSRAGAQLVLECESKSFFPHPHKPLLFWGHRAKFAPARDLDLPKRQTDIFGH
ncbi:hypothetical protein DdX_05207 [Ditylenchus destructor]|uniref:F-box domain-containing protein n=1 Tax=Ditylenchus destructor TaxID=166010 RepID=A0AAD4RAP9_9BILA|nr:hypothetical protein DdX_05207 [Ditylenchus destructor]